MKRISQLAQRFLRGERSFRRDERGVVLIDAAFAFIFLSLVLISIVDFGTAYLRKMTLTNAVRAGSQLALVRTPSLDYSADAEEEIASIAEIEAAVISAAPFIGEDDIHNLSVSLDCSCPDGVATICYSNSETLATPSCPEPRAYVTVALSYTHNFLLPFPAIGESLELSARNSVRVK